jgi:hypothetical protein
MEYSYLKRIDADFAASYSGQQDGMARLTIGTKPG